MEHITLTGLFLRIGAVAVLLGANAFFVAAEFGLVAARRTRIDAMAREGVRGAASVQRAFGDLNRQLSAAQLGITVASILLGYVAEETVAVFLHRWFDALPTPLDILASGAIVSIVAISVITFLHVVIGEQAPKTWAIRYPERTSLWAARPLMFFAWITLPLTNLLNSSSNVLLRMFGIKKASGHERAHSPEEIVMMVRQAQRGGHFAAQDADMIEGVMEFTEKNARHVMTPRTDVVDLSADLTVSEAAKKAAQIGRSRYPVTWESIDNIVGVVHVKHILGALLLAPDDSIKTLAREPVFIPGSREIEDVLTDMKRTKSHFAVVLDEFGGTAGIVTMEDLLEEIVGEIYDEYDAAQPIPQTGVDYVMLSGEVNVDDLNTTYGLELPTGGYQTIGGFIFGRLGRLPRVGDAIEVDATRFEVAAMDRRRVAQLKMSGGGTT